VLPATVNTIRSTPSRSASIGCEEGGTLKHLAAALLAGAAVTGAPTLEELTHITYSGIKEVAGPVTLKDGQWEKRRVAVTLAPGFRVTGDLDGDGAEEAVVLLAVNPGGSGTFEYVAVTIRAAKGVRSVATAPLGDRVQIRSARIAGRKLLFSVVRPGSKDARCCPGELADLAWTLAGGRLRSSAAKVTGRLTPDVLAGKEWVLRAWKRGAPAPDQPEVTLRYEGGRLAGRSGCNRYSTAVTTGDAPGDVSIAPVMVTRMACAEPQMAVEARFVKQLEAVKKIGFWLGQLALSYPLEGQAPQEMLFDARTPAAAAAAKQ
jgi:heat shock protein HslJ